MSKKRKRPMTAKRYREILIELGFNEGNDWTDEKNISNKGQREAARFLVINERTSRRWAKGKSPIDARTAMLLEVLAKYKINPEDARGLI